MNKTLLASRVPAALTILLGTWLGAVSCASPNRGNPLPGDAAPATARAPDGPVGGAEAAPPGPQDALGDDGPAPIETDGGPTCPVGYHLCGDTCADDKSAKTCGLACEPCPTITGGVATCEEGTRCGVACPPQQKPCGEACVEEAAVCDNTCPKGSNVCGKICVDAKSVSACGVTCLPCPTSPNGVTTCDGDKCDLTCNPGFHRCADGCVSDLLPATCGTACTACPPPEGGTATCDGTSCAGACPTGMQLCAGKCIGKEAACMGTCSAGKHDCKGNCAPDTDINSCGKACTPCPAVKDAESTCVNGTCGFVCRAGFHRCGNECRSNMSTGSCGPSSCDACVPPASATATCNGVSCDFRCDAGRKCNGQCIGDTVPCGTTCPSGRKHCPSTNTCIPSTGCCGDSECATCKACVSNTCSNEATGADKRSACGGKGCFNGGCRACNPQDPAVCMDGDMKKCSSSGTYVVDKDCGTLGCDGGGCKVICGGYNQACCAGASACAAGLQCKDGKCMRALGQKCAARAECASGFCADGFCCESACDGGGRCGATDKSKVFDDRCSNQGKCELKETAACAPYLCSTNKCATGCLYTGGCTEGWVCKNEDTGKCVRCIDDSDCKNGQFCDTTTDQCKPLPTCAGPRMKLCGTECRDTWEDPNHCGACGRACDPGVQCKEPGSCDN